MLGSNSLIESIVAWGTRKSEGGSCQDVSWGVIAEWVMIPALNPIIGIEWASDFDKPQAGGSTIQPWYFTVLGQKLGNNS